MSTIDVEARAAKRNIPAAAALNFDLDNHTDPAPHLDPIVLPAKVRSTRKAARRTAAIDAN